MSWWKILLIVLGIIIFILLVLSCWYRYKVNKSRVQPFEPPSWAPNWLFPRPEPEYVTHVEMGGGEEELGTGVY